MFERIIRPFQTGEVLQTKRIVKSTSIATGDTAILSWGAPGTIPAGVMQKAATPAGVPFQDGGLHGDFKVVNAEQTWTQTGTPKTENIVVDGVVVKRVREITFNTINPASNPPSNAFVAGAISNVIAGLVRDIEGSRASSATYKTTWN